MSKASAVLGDVVLAIQTGRSPKTLEREAGPDEPGILKLSAVSWGEFRPQAAKAMPPGFVGEAAHRVRQGDFIVSRANTSELVGAVAIAQADYDNRYLSDKLLRLVIDRRLAHPEYLLHALRAPLARAHIQRHAGGSNESMQNIAQGALLDTPIHLPPVAEQQACAARLASAMALAQAAAFSVDDQVRDGERLDAAVLNALLPPQALGIGPGLHASHQPLISLARLESGHTPSRRHPEWWGGDVPWLALPDIRKLHGLVAHDTAEHTNDLGLANSSARLLPPGTVCLSRTASIGFVTMLGRPMATSQDFCNWVCNPEKLDAEYLMYAFMASTELLRELGSGAVHKTIYMPTIESFHIAAPPLAEQQRIARQLRDRLAAARTLRETLAERQREIECLPQRILAAAFGDAD